MTKKIMAHVTDAHLGQKLVMGGEMAGDKMSYDSRRGEHEMHLRRILDDVARKGISEVVFGGDIGNEESVGRFFEIVEGYGFALSVVLGNHDHLRHVARYWKTGYGTVEGKMCSSRIDGPVKRIVLDSSGNTIGDRQLQWLRGELAGARNVVLFVHHPILPIDTPVEQSAALKDREAALAVLGDADAEVSVFCGHYHMLDEARDGNIRQYVTPAVSYQIVKQADRIRVDPHVFGYRILEIDGAELRTETVLLSEAA